MPDVLGNLRFILAYCINIVASAPKLTVTVLELQIAKLVINHQTALTFQVSDEARHAHLKGYLDQHMDMVETTLGFEYLHSFPFAELSQYFSYSSFLLAIENLSAIFRCKGYVVFEFHFVCAKLFASPIVTSF